jgi:hypothetical protein
MRTRTAAGIALASFSVVAAFAAHYALSPRTAHAADSMFVAREHVAEVKVTAAREQRLEILVRDTPAPAPAARPKSTAKPKPRPHAMIEDATSNENVAESLPQLPNPDAPSVAVESDREAAINAVTRLDYASAASSFERACKSGDAFSCSALGNMLSGGRNVKREETRGKELLNQACAMSDPWACSLVTPPAPRLSPKL